MGDLQSVVKHIAVVPECRHPQHSAYVVAEVVREELRMHTREPCQSHACQEGRSRTQLQLLRSSRRI